MATFPPRPEGRGLQVDIKGVLADENHFFLEMQLAEDMEDYFTNKRYECLKSLISKETKHFFQSYMNGYKQNYFDFCIENNINLFNFSNEDEEILVDLNFQLA